MEENSREKQTLEALCSIPHILNIKWASDYKAFVYLSEEIPEESKDNIRNLLRQISDKYEVVFEVVRKKNWWQSFLEALDRTYGGCPPIPH